MRVFGDLQLQQSPQQPRRFVIINAPAHGLTRYHTKSSKNFADHLMTEKQLCDLLKKCGFKVVSTETFKDSSRSSNVPVEYIKGVKV